MTLGTTEVEDDFDAYRNKNKSSLSNCEKFIVKLKQCCE